MPKISLARALKEKKRLASRIHEIVNDRTENVYREGEKPLVNLHNLIDCLRDLKRRLILIKSLIAKKNSEVGIYDLIYEAEELKEELRLFEQMDVDTTPYKERNPVTGEVTSINRIAFFSYEEIESRKLSIKKKLNNIQDKIDELNGSTFFEYNNILLWIIQFLTREEFEYRFEYNFFLFREIKSFAQFREW